MEIALIFLVFPSMKFRKILHTIRYRCLLFKTIREVGGEGTGSGIRKEVGDREKLRKISQHCITFYNISRTEAGTHMEEGGKQEFKVWEAEVSDPPAPLHNRQMAKWNLFVN